MDWSQILYLALLLTGTVAALPYGNKFIVLVMWANFAATATLNANPFYVLAADIACIAALVVFLKFFATQIKPALTIAAIFCVMLVIYPFEEVLGKNTTYAIVDVLAYVQIFAMGSTGFGKAIHYGRRRYGIGSGASVFMQKVRLHAEEVTGMAVGKGKRP